MWNCYSLENRVARFCWDWKSSENVSNTSELSIFKKRTFKEKRIIQVLSWTLKKKSWKLVFASGGIRIRSCDFWKKSERRKYGFVLIPYLFLEPRMLAGLVLKYSWSNLFLVNKLAADFFWKRCQNTFYIFLSSALNQVLMDSVYL